MPSGNTLRQERFVQTRMTSQAMGDAVLETLAEGETVHLFRRKLRPVSAPRWYAVPTLERSMTYRNERLDLRLMRDPWGTFLQLAPSAMTEGVRYDSFIWRISGDWLKGRKIDPGLPVLKPPVILSAEDSTMSPALADAPFFRRVAAVLRGMGRDRRRVLNTKRRTGELEFATLATLYFQPIWTALYAAAHPSKTHIYVMGKGLSTKAEAFLAPLEVYPFILTPTLNTKEKYLSNRKR